MLTKEEQIIKDVVELGHKRRMVVHFMKEIADEDDINLLYNEYVRLRWSPTAEQLVEELE